MDPDSDLGGSKTYGSGSRSATLFSSDREWRYGPTKFELAVTLLIVKIFMLNTSDAP
jgi:hypothetical protein